MSLTILYSSKSQQHCLVLNLRWVIALFLMLLSLILFTSWQQYAYNARQTLLLKNALDNKQGQVHKKQYLQQKQQMSQQLIVLAGQVGSMQAQVARLNAFGQHLADKNNVKDSSFNFSKLPPMGGPINGGPLPEIELEHLKAQMSELQQTLNTGDKHLSLLATMLIHQEVSQQSYISGMPVIAKGSWLSSPYGVRFDPFSGSAKMHRGVDVAGPSGVDIIATGSGIVSWAGKRSGYGNMVELLHPNGLTTRYAHTAEVLVSEGDAIEKGQVIALVGSSGRSTGPHVHYEVLKNGTQINPSKYIYRNPAN